MSRDIDQLFLDERMKLREFFKTSGTSVCITIDTWTSLQKLNYMCITAHYVDKDWNLHKKIINFCLVDSHKGEEMGRQIDGCLREWGIARVLAITVDNASANETCIDYLKGRLTTRGCDVVKGEHLHMRCAAHVLNWIVTDGLKVINPSIKRVRDAVEFVSLLCLDVLTRWNSTYLMLSVTIKFEKAFERFEVEDPHFKVQLAADSRVPTPADWDVVRRISDVLLVFYELTLRVSTSLHVTSHLVYHEIDTVENLLRERGADNQNANCPFIKEMEEMMQLKYDKYWANARKVNKLVYLVVVVDPQYKFGFISYVLKDEYGDEEGSKLIFDLKNALDDLYDDYRCLHHPQSQSVESSQSSDLLQKKPRYARSDRYKKLQAQSGESGNKNDLDIYLKEEAFDGEKEDFNILK